MFGIPREKVPSVESFLATVHPDDLELVKQSMDGALRGEPYDLDFRIRRPEDGTERVIHANGEVTWDAEGQPTRFFGTVQDVTERKKAEHTLRESQERLAILFESAPDAIYVIDPDGRFVDVNKAAEEMVGFTKAELIGKTLAESGLLSGEDLSKAAANLREAVGPERSGPREYMIRRKDGSRIAVEIRTFPVTIGGRTLTLGIARDSTTRKDAEQKLLDDREQLKSLASQLSLTEERERHRLAGVLHDQIGQSLVISKIKLDQLRKGGASGAIVKALDEVAACLGQVIRNTRTLTFDLSYPILYELGFESAVAEWLTEHIQEKHGIETDFEDDGQPKPLDDDIRALLFCNVRELLINVVKHARARRVKVTTRRLKDQIRTSVEDDGVGFDPVEVTAMSAKRAEFGLFSIRKRLEQLGGLFEVVSAPGRGTRITMTAPLKYQANQTRTGVEDER
jgi:PAS domain S-box-containing protein